MSGQSQADKDIEDLLDFCVKTPSFTFDDCHAVLGLDQYRFTKAVRGVRELFGEDQINLICEPQGARERWLYRLVGTYAEQRVWAKNRDGDLTARLVTMQNVAKSLVNATDGRTLDGKRARLIASVLASLHAQIEALEGSLA